MAAVRQMCNSEIQRNFNLLKTLRTLKIDGLNYSTASPLPEKVKGRLRKHRPAEAKDFTRYAEIYRDFLPDPDPKHRQLLREKLERIDMLARRKIVDIPEFYPGSIVAVTISDKHAPGKNSRFLGICIEKRGCGLRTNFTLRNVIDNQGIEINYDLYDPTIQLIECIRLEKRLDEELHYLRDAPEEYSTFPLDMEQEFLPEGSKVPLNDILVPLKPRPYIKRWERHDFKGLTNLDVGYKRKIKMEKHATPWEKYDLMKIYRATHSDEDRLEIFYQVHEDLDELEKNHRKKIRSVLISRSKKK